MHHFCICVLYSLALIIYSRKEYLYNSIPACYIDECHVHGQYTHNTINLWIPVYTTHGQ